MLALRALIAATALVAAALVPAAVIAPAALVPSQGPARPIVRMRPANCFSVSTARTM